MLKKQILQSILVLLLGLTAFPNYAQPDADGIGQTIQIYTRFHSFVGKPTLLIMIRDLDHDQNIPYLFDVTKGDDFWLIFTYGHHYLIQASTLQIKTYQPRFNTFKVYTTHNFCHLESRGRIMRGESLYITIEGDLSPNTGSYSCNISRFTDTNFVVVKPQAD